MACHATLCAIPYLPPATTKLILLGRN